MSEKTIFADILGILKKHLDDSVLRAEAPLLPDEKNFLCSKYLAVH